ncbi:MAG TPA: hypothetical protein VJX23_10180 [Candidatus Binataceae bacterium]|nr:hypothetical protein [Candidatus Binataceae bacterium]
MARYCESTTAVYDRSLQRTGQSGIMYEPPDFMEETGVLNHCSRARGAL